MTIMDRHSRLIGSHGETENEPETCPLDPNEIRMIADARIEQLARFAGSPRLHAVDSKGDTPLHLAARTGNLALCDLFVCAGADPQARNHECLTPADVASAEGHPLAAQLLFSLVGDSQGQTSPEALANELHVDVEWDRAAAAPSIESAPPEANEDQIDVLAFEPEEDPEHFFDRSAGDLASGAFIALVTSSPNDFAEADVNWEIDLSPAQIVGDGIGSDAVITRDQDGEHDFLKVRNRGRRSAKRAVVQSGTRLSIDPDVCRSWATEILERKWFSSDDIDTLISSCKGNGDPNELRVNLLRTLEAAGLELFDEETEGGDILWDIRSDLSADDLADAVEAALSRATRLPGTSRFFMDKADEARLLEPMVRAKRELQLAILSCEPAVRAVLGAIDKVLDGSWKPDLVTLRPVLPARPENAETAAFSDAAQILRSWNAAGRVMDGRRRRGALQALDALDLSFAFQSAMVRVLAEQPLFARVSRELAGLISAFETAVERLIMEHLPYARRFAARNVEDGEDPEDVFQVAFTGLQRSTRRFDPELGNRFVVYCTFWMKQALTRWRADEGAIVRIPAHRHEQLTSLDRLIQNLEANIGRSPSHEELAEELKWPLEVIRRLLRIPRQSLELDCFEERESAVSAPDQERAIDQADAARIISELLTELPDRQADVIRMRFGIGHDNEMILEEIGQIYGVTRERIRQIEKKGLDSLRKSGRIRSLKPLLRV